MWYQTYPYPIQSISDMSRFSVTWHRINECRTQMKLWDSDTTNVRCAFRRIVNVLYTEVHCITFHALILTQSVSCKPCHLQVRPCTRWHLSTRIITANDDVIKWKHFPRYWPFVEEIQRSPVNSPHKGQRRGALMFSLICAWIHGWVNHCEAGDLRRHRAHYDVIVMHRPVILPVKWDTYCYTAIPVQPIIDGWRCSILLVQVTYSRLLSQ